MNQSVTQYRIFLTNDSVPFSCAGENALESYRVSGVLGLLGAQVTDWFASPFDSDSLPFEETVRRKSSTVSCRTSQTIQSIRFVIVVIEATSV